MSIQETLEKLGLASEQTTSHFHKGTRDNPNVDVYRDKNSGVIFINDPQLPADEYTSTVTYEAKMDFMRKVDNDRRLATTYSLYSGKSIADFGCEHGDFLLATQEFTARSVGIELQEDLIKSLNNRNILCVNSMSKIPDASIDTFFLFHSFEHLPEPLDMLTEIHSKLRDSGKIVIEVPHANDFLISFLGQKSFIDFTLWSQHLILHTRASLKSFLEYSGYKNISIRGVQRYPISNHMHWMTNNKPGGHRSKLSVLETPDLNQAYAAALAAADATDTLLAIADAS